MNRLLDTFLLFLLIPVINAVVLSVCLLTLIMLIIRSSVASAYLSGNGLNGPAAQ